MWCFLTCSGNLNNNNNDNNNSIIIIGQVIINPSLYLSVNEGEEALFSCSGSGPHLLQFNNNITSHPRLTQTSVDDSSSGDDGMTVYYSFNDTSRYDNGTTIQCFFNGYSTNVLTILVDCESVIV